MTNLGNLDFPGCVSARVIQSVKVLHLRKCAVCLLNGLLQSPQSSFWELTQAEPHCRYKPGKTGRLRSILLLVFLFLAWPFYNPSTQTSPGCLTVYGWIDQSNDAWKRNVGGPILWSVEGNLEGTIRPDTPGTKTFFLGWFLGNVSAQLLQPSSADRSQRESTFFLQSWDDFPMWSASTQCHTVALSARVISSRGLVWPVFSLWPYSQTPSCHIKFFTRP